MSDSRVLERFSRKETQAESDGGTDDLGAFGWLRGNRERAIMLEFRKKSGDIFAIGYGWLQKVEFDPSVGITLWFPGQKVRLLGRNLNTVVRPNVRLFEGLIRHKVPWVQESADLETFDVGPAETVIETIEG